MKSQEVNFERWSAYKMSSPERAGVRASLNAEGYFHCGRQLPGWELSR
nr:hypothetical protein [Agrobacterium larrymoorei]